MGSSVLPDTRRLRPRVHRMTLSGRLPYLNLIAHPLMKRFASFPLTIRGTAYVPNIPLICLRLREVGR